MNKRVKAYTKIEAHYQSIMMSIQFRNWVEEIRSKYQLPKPKGRIPRKPVYPKDSLIEIINLIEIFCEKNGLSSNWETQIRNYVYFGKDGLNLKKPNDSLCFFTDIKESHERVWKVLKEDSVHGDWSDFSSKYDLEYFDKTHPIVLRISPNANLDNLVEYIKHRKRYLLELQGKYVGNKKDSAYGSDFFDRNMLIVDLYMKKNKHGEIRAIIEKKFNTKISEEEIRAIISRLKRISVTIPSL